MPVMVSVLGTSGSGKTTTIEYLTSCLSKIGLRVGVAKHIHREGFTIDTEGKDTWKHAKAGAKVVIGTSPNELAVVKKTTSEAKFEEIREILSGQDLDIALLEGFSTATAKNTKVYKIVAAKNMRDLKYTLGRVPPPVLAFTGAVAQKPTKIRDQSVPVIDIPREGPALASIVRRLLRPKELADLFNRAAIRHGGKCIGLAIGVRAAYIASSVLRHNPSTPHEISCGTKHCIADAFQSIYPKSRVRLLQPRDDRISIKSQKAELRLQLAPKDRVRFKGIRQVLGAPERTLFASVDFTSM